MPLQSHATLFRKVDTMRTLVGLTFLMLGATVTAVAQDPVQVDPKHYHVLFEDAQIRVLHIIYGPHEKSVMHQHPVGTCAVILTGGNMRFHTPDGKFTDNTSKPGDVTCTPAGPGKDLHNPENMGDDTTTVILMERKPTQP